MSKKDPSKPLRLSKAARILGIPIHIARHQQIPRIYEHLQQLLADPPTWLPEAQSQRRAIATANQERELAASARCAAVAAGAKAALITALQAAPAYDTRSEEFAFLALDGAMISLMGRYSESALAAAAWELYPEAAELLMGDES